jgi:cobalamin biosynthetic protein CobC
MQQGQSNIGPLMEHGGRLSAARRAFPNAPLPWVDLSTGINPHAFPLPAFTDNDWQALPDLEQLDALKATAANFFGLPNINNIVAVPGSEIAVRLLPTLRPKSSVAIVGPTYSSHADAWSHHSVQQVSTLREALSGHDVVIVCNPNNPDGKTWSHDELQGAANTLAHKGGWLIIDEAFSDTQPQDSHNQNTEGLITLRSFGKFFGHAGLRLGFVIAETALCQRLQKLLGDWPVSGTAIKTGLAAYTDTNWITKTRYRLNQEAARLDGYLKQTGGTLVGGTPLFRLIDHLNAELLFVHLARNGILARPFHANPSWLRFGLPGYPDAWDRLEAALNSFGEKA